MDILWILTWCSFIFYPFLQKTSAYECSPNSLKDIIKDTKVACKAEDLNSGVTYEETELPYFVKGAGMVFPLRCCGIYQDQRTLSTCSEYGTWSELYPPCKIITCPAPASIRSGWADPSKPQYAVDDAVEVNCDVGYWYNGTNPRVCQRDQTWSGKDGLCQEVICPALPPPFHGVIATKPPYKYEAKMEVSCEPGFNHSGYHHLQCMGNNSWTGNVGECYRVKSISCNTNEALVKNGKVTPQLQEAKYGQEIVTSCIEGFKFNGTMVRVCQANGTWSGYQGSCDDITCPNEFRTKKGIIESTDPGFLGEGVITCDEGYSWVGNKSQARCTSDGTWQVNGECKGTLQEASPLIIILVVIIILLVIIIIMFGLFFWRYWKKNRNGVETGDSSETEGLLGGRGKEIKMSKVDKLHYKKIDLDKQYVKILLVERKTLETSKKVNDYLSESATSTNIEWKDIIGKVKYEDPDSDSDSEDSAVSRKRKPLLMEGRAGVGKTTLVQKLIHSVSTWAEGFTPFLFNIRKLVTLKKSKITLEGFFKRCNMNEKTASRVETVIENVKHVIVLIDGLDEFPGLKAGMDSPDKLKNDDKADPVEWCLALLRGDIMAESVRIIVSRPFNDLKEIGCDPIIEVMGLSKDSIPEFINKFVDVKERERVKACIMENPLILSVSAITYYCYRFCKVFENNKKIPTKELKTYTRITAFFIEDYLRRWRFFSLPLKPLARLAYRGLVERHPHENQASLVFDKEELKECGIKGDAYEKCGILVTTGMKLKTESVCTTEFDHLSIQEFLSMAYLLRQGHIAKAKALSMWSSGTFKMAQIYLFGLRYEKSENIKNLMRQLNGHQNNDDLATPVINELSKMEESEERMDGLLQAIHMVYETQNDQVAEKLAKTIFKDAKELLFRNTLLTAVDVNAIIFVLRHSEDPCVVRLDRITMDDTSASLLSNGLQDFGKLNGISLNGTKVPIKNFLKMLTKNPNIEELSLDSIGIDGEVLEDLTECLDRLQCVKKLSLGGSQFSKEEFRKLVTAIAQMNKLEDLSIENTGLGDEMLPDVITHLMATDLERPKKLNLNGNTFSAEGIEKLSKALAQKNHLGHVSLAHAGINNDTVMRIAECFASNKTLKHLDIRGERLTDDNMKSLKEKLQGNETLEIVQCTDNAGDFASLVRVQDTSRRIEVTVASEIIQFAPSWPMDLVDHSFLSGSSWSLKNKNLYIMLKQVDYSIASTKKWSLILDQIKDSDFMEGELVIFLAENEPIQFLLESLTKESLEALIDKNVWRIQVYDGEISLSDIENFMEGLLVVPNTEGAEVITTESKSILIRLYNSRIPLPQGREDDDMHCLLCEPNIDLIVSAEGLPTNGNMNNNS